MGERLTRSISPSSTRTLRSVSTCSTVSSVSVMRLLLRKLWICGAVGYCGAAEIGKSGWLPEDAESACFCFGVLCRGWECGCEFVSGDGRKIKADGEK